jgi:hypothetical protein
VSSEKSEKKEIDVSITIPILRIELHFKREKPIVELVDIKPGEIKILPLKDRRLILHYDDNTKKLRYAIVDQNGLKEVGEIF